MAKKFIKKAIKRPGALRAKVRRMFGKRGFTSRGTIKSSVIAKLAKRPGRTGKQARLARTLRKMRH